MSGLKVEGKEVYAFVQTSKSRLVIFENIINSNPENLIKEVITTAKQDESVSSCEVVEVSNEADLARIILS
jgi:hypothetical protein